MDDDDKFKLEDLWLVWDLIAEVVAAVLVLGLYALVGAGIIALIVAMPVALAIIIGAALIAAAIIGRR